MDELIERIHRYRSAGSDGDGIHVLGGLKVDDLDYALMGAENTSARFNNPGETVTGGAWFAVDPQSSIARLWFPNSHASMINGEMLNETAHMEITLREYQPDPAEVAWHHMRVTELRAQGVEQPVRVRIMSEERARKPWTTREAHNRPKAVVAATRPKRFAWPFSWCSG